MGGRGEGGYAIIDGNLLSFYGSVFYHAVVLTCESLTSDLCYFIIITL
jgi:hypothetical protein